jgi:pyridoxamine 5'-phosphate oxidase
MNQKNSLGLNLCFKDEENPIVLFREWFEEAKKSEINGANAFALGTVDKNSHTSVRIILLKDFNNEGFVFYTNLNSDKSKAIKESPNISMCFHWKNLLRQVRIVGAASQVSDKEADDYFHSRPYGSKIGAWASDQSSILDKREDLYDSIKKYEIKFPDQNNVPRPNHWSGWRLEPIEIEFWLGGENRIHERLKYIRRKNNWEKVLLNP